MSRDRQEIARGKIAQSNLASNVLIAAVAAVGTVLLVCSGLESASTNSNVWLGVETVELDQTVINRYNVHARNGLLVSRTFLGSPAAVAGIENGDVIRRWNGVSVTNQQQFERLMGTAADGQIVKITLDRQGKPVVAFAEMRPRPGSF